MKNVYDDKVYYLDFSAAAHTTEDKLFISQVSADVKTVKYALKQGTAKFANLFATFVSDPSKSEIKLQNLSIEGLNVHAKSSDNLIYRETGATPPAALVAATSGMVTLDNLLTLKRQTPTSNVYDVILDGDDENNVIFTLTYVSVGWDVETSVELSTAQFTVGAKKTYPNLPVTGGKVAEYIANLDATSFAVESHYQQNHAENIANASLLLQLRANKNVLNASADIADPETFLPGDYDVCVSFKDCDGEFSNLNVFRITLTQDNKIVGKWGKNTTKCGSVIAANHDSAKLKSATGSSSKANVSVCGSLNGVFNNTNDFVLCIENVMQLFSLFGTDALIEDAGDNVPVFNMEHDEYPVLFAALANTKLYLSIRYVCIAADSESSTASKPHQMCRGQLNPFDNSRTQSNSGYTFIKGYTIAEITNMMDHPLMQSNLSREITLCISNQDVLESDEANN
jgi:hypothetical protein